MEEIQQNIAERVAEEHRHHAKDHGGDWNHGETSGVVISMQSNEVIYWAEAF